MNIEILKSKDNQWYFRCVAKNGKILCHSETYHRLSDAKKGAESLVRGILNSLLYVCPEFEWVKMHKGNYRLKIHTNTGDQQ